MSTNCIGTSFEKHIGIVFCLNQRQKDALVFLANAFFLRHNKGIKELKLI